jgi:hypothetical protein
VRHQIVSFKLHPNHWPFLGWLSSGPACFKQVAASSGSI